MTTLTVEIPDFLADALATYVASACTSSPSKAVAGAIALWLLQQGYSGPELTRAYLDAILPETNVTSLRRPRRRSGADAA